MDLGVEKNHPASEACRVELAAFYLKAKKRNRDAQSLGQLVEGPAKFGVQSLPVFHAVT